MRTNVAQYSDNMQVNSILEIQL